MRLPRLRDLARAITRRLPLPPYRTQKDLVGGCDSDPGRQGSGSPTNHVVSWCLEDWICEDDPVRVIDVFVGGLDLPELHFGRIDPEGTGWPHAGEEPAEALATFLCGMD
jgi:hypothetical protein